MEGLSCRSFHSLPAEWKISIGMTAVDEKPPSSSTTVTSSMLASSLVLAQTAVIGSILRPTSVILFAGKPLSFECSWITASSSAM